MSTDPARIAIARDVVAHLGITLADLAYAEHPVTGRIDRAGAADENSPAAAGPASPEVPARFAIPTVHAYLPRVRAAAGPARTAPTAATGR